MKKKEESTQMQVCQFLKMQYPDLIFTCDLASGMKLTIGQAVKAKKMRSSRGLPDLMIFKPNKHYKGLFLEFKSVTPFKKDGTLKKDEHLKEQSEIHRRLEEEGYLAEFTVEFYHTIELINCYLKDV